MTSTPESFFESIGRPIVGDEVFDAIEDTVYFIKDSLGRYVAVNMPLVKRCGLQHKHELVGRMAKDIFPPDLGEVFSAQDIEVIRTGQPIHEQLELHLYPTGQEGWCLTWKEPLSDDQGNIVGLCGISRDLNPISMNNRNDIEPVSKVLDVIRDRYAETITMEELEKISGFSAFQLDRRIRDLFGVSTKQYITRTRIDVARHSLTHTTKSITQIALACGYSDQSSFTRRFRQSVGLTPQAYRDNRVNIAAKENLA